MAVPPKDTDFRCSCPTAFTFFTALTRTSWTLMAQPFDAARLKTLGDMFPIADQVTNSVNTGFGAFSVSGNGMLVYRSGGGAFSSRELVWMDRAGKRLSAVGKPGDFGPM